MDDPSEQEVLRGTGALVPFVHAWDLSLNPENLGLMAYAVLRAARSDASLADIDHMTRELIAEDADAARRMEEAMQEALDKRERDDERD